MSRIRVVTQDELAKGQQFEPGDDAHLFWQCNAWVLLTPGGDDHTLVGDEDDPPLADAARALDMLIATRIELDEEES